MMLHAAAPATVTTTRSRQSEVSARIAELIRHGRTLSLIPCITSKGGATLAAVAGYVSAAKYFANFTGDEHLG